VNEHDAARLVHDFEHRRLPKSQWTHEAHLVVCRAVLRRLAPADALDRLRGAIRSYNESTGTPNTDTSGYHETLTEYYVGAGDASGAASLGELFADPACAREAPLAHWSRDLLFSVEARRAWVPPDLAPIPWRSVGLPAAG
jgi:hypothetical protein